MRYLCHLQTFALSFITNFDALLGPSELNQCARIRSGHTITVNGEAMEENGMDLQFFVDCSQPGDTIIFDTEAVEPKTTTVIRHPMVFDVAKNMPRVVFKCPRAGTIFDAQ